MRIKSLPTLLVIGGLSGIPAAPTAAGTDCPSMSCYGGQQQAFQHTPAPDGTDCAPYTCHSAPAAGTCATHWTCSMFAVLDKGEINNLVRAVSLNDRTELRRLAQAFPVSLKYDTPTKQFIARDCSGGTIAAVSLPRGIVHES